MNKFFTALCQLIGSIIVIIALVIATFIGMSYVCPAFAQYGQLSPDAQLAYDEEMARIEWIKRNGDMPPKPTQADLEYMQRYTEQLQAQYDKEGK
ncbi:hypothetical protein JFL47_09495 [Haemophilus haemoglobinophilus]|nr:hypothetical protein [Canicola haemoglobinophilus]